MINDRMQVRIFVCQSSISLKILFCCIIPNWLVFVNFVVVTNVNESIKTNMFKEKAGHTYHEMHKMSKT